jgi:hypothetical protein
MHEKIHCNPSWLSIDLKVYQTVGRGFRQTALIKFDEKIRKSGDVFQDGDARHRQNGENAGTLHSHH